MSVAQVVLAAERHERATLSALAAGMVKLHRSLRLLMVDATSAPTASTIAEMRSAVSDWAAAAVAVIVAATLKARAAGALAVDEARQGRPASEASEVDIPDLAEQRIASSVATVGEQLTTALISQVVAVAGGAQTEAEALAAVGKTPAGSPVFGRVVERLQGIAAAELGSAWGQGAQRRGGVDLRKRWALGRNKRHRQSHITASRRDPIPWGEQFIVGGHATPYPRGPGLPARETRHCSCRLVPVVAD